MERFFVFGLVILVASCGISREENLTWHKNTSITAKKDYFEKQCRELGFKSGTSDMLNCINNRMTASRANAQAQANAIVFGGNKY